MKYAYITMKERAEMNRMGWKYKVCFVKPNGVPFHKYFKSEEERDAFIKEAAEYGVRETARA